MTQLAYPHAMAGARSSPGPSDADSDPLKRWIERRDETALARATSAEAAAATLRLADAAATEYPGIDADQLISAGFAVLRSGHGAAAARALAPWLLQKPTVARLDVAALLLQGLWVHAGRGAQRAEPDAVEALLEACRVLSASDGVCPSAWLALAAALPALDASLLRVRVLEALQAAVEDPRTSIALRDHLRVDIARTAGPTEWP